MNLNWSVKSLYECIGEHLSSLSPVTVYDAQKIRSFMAVVHSQLQYWGDPELSVGFLKRTDFRAYDGLERIFNKAKDDFGFEP